MLEYSLQSTEGLYIETAAKELTLAISPGNVFSSTFPNELNPSWSISNRRIALVSQYYRKDGAYGDIDTALLKNLINPAIGEIFLLNEDIYDFRSFPFSEKIHQIHLGKRLTFSDAFLYINEALNGREVILGKMIAAGILRCVDLYISKCGYILRRDAISADKKLRIRFE